jgi:predicted nucleic acid-binding protein
MGAEDRTGEEDEDDIARRAVEEASSGLMGITLDTGALIALERRSHRMWRIIDTTDAGIVVTVPSAVVAEWWRGSSRRLEAILGMFDVEPLSERLAKLTGEALAAVQGASVVDAMVMVSAALRGDVVYTSDEEDLVRLRDARFPNTHVLRI